MLWLNIVSELEIACKDHNRQAVWPAKILGDTCQLWSLQGLLHAVRKFANSRRHPHYLPNIGVGVAALVAATVSPVTSRNAARYNLV